MGIRWYAGPELPSETFGSSALVLVNEYVNGFVKNSGSSTVTVQVKVFASVFLIFSVRCSLSLCSNPKESSQVRSSTATVSTTSVSPSHFAVESPNQLG